MHVAIGWARVTFPILRTSKRESKAPKSCQRAKEIYFFIIVTRSAHVQESAICSRSIAVRYGHRFLSVSLACLSLHACDVRCVRLSIIGDQIVVGCGNWLSRLRSVTEAAAASVSPVLMRLVSRQGRVVEQRVCIRSQFS